MRIFELILALNGFRGQYGDNIEVLVSLDDDVNLDTPFPHVVKTNTGKRVVVL